MRASCKSRSGLGSIAWHARAHGGGADDTPIEMAHNGERRMTATTMNQLFERVTAHYPERVAFTTPSRRWSFSELDDAVRRTASGLRALGIGRGDRVACLTKHTTECV